MKEESNTKFKVRINAQHEDGVYLGGAYFVFNTAPVNSDQWHEFMWVRIDDPNPLSGGMVKFIDENIGYTYMGMKYAVTVDAGRTWHCWESIKDLPKDWPSRYKYIKEVHIERDGTGKMVFDTFSARDAKAPALSTKDYGQHWKMEFNGEI